jgi:outer membrane receptor protein involved in Fe transport
VHGEIVLVKENDYPSDGFNAFLHLDRILNMVIPGIEVSSSLKFDIMFRPSETHTGSLLRIAFVSMSGFPESPRNLLLAVTLLMFSISLLSAGTTGIVEGSVLDRQTGELLPGVHVFVPELQIGTSSDSVGTFSLPNIRAGTYEIRFSHVGYKTFVLLNVTVNPDLRTRLRIGLEQATLQMQEVVVVQEKPIIQTDVTATTFLANGQELRALPIDQPYGFIAYKPGTTMEGNIRGGKATEVTYLVDGLPVLDLLQGGVATDVPISSLIGMTVYTGGFEAEYGNALSGVVNLVTRAGGNEFSLFGRGGSDHLFGGTQNSRQTSFEGTASGPLIRDRLFFVASGSGTLSGTRWWQDMQKVFPWPIDRSLNAFGKLDYVVSPSLRLGLQVLSSDHDWRDYEFPWRYDLAGLPPEKKTSRRLALIASQTVGNDFYYSASLSWYSIRSRIGAGSKNEVPVNDPYQYDFFLRYIVAGARAWWMDARQNTYTAKIDVTRKVGGAHLFKFGFEFNQYNLTSDLVKFEPRKTYFGKPLVYEPQQDFSSAYSYHPRSGSLYAQDKIDLLKEGVLLSVGLRYDFLDPRASRPAIEAAIKGDSTVYSTGPERKATFKQQVSPRIGMAMPVGEKAYFFFNLGWYFQHPLFDYLYTGIDRVALGRGITAVTGNPDLEPERSTAWEVSFKYALPLNVVASIAYFKKETTNLTDTKTFVPGDSKVAGSYGFAEFVNDPYARVDGWELVMTRDRGEWVTGELSYTYMVTEATSGSAYDGYYIAQYGLPPSRRVAPLGWDQRHTVKAQITITQRRNFSLTTFVQWHSGRPFTSYPTKTGFESVEAGDFVLNNGRMPEYFSIDLRAEKYFPLSIGESSLLTIYLDVRNLTDRKNVSWVDSNGRIGGELSDPSGYFIGRRTSVGLQYEY